MLEATMRGLGPPGGMLEHGIKLPDGAVIRVERKAGVGSAAPQRVVFVHALGMDLANWTEVRAALPDTVESVAIDVRGHGRSTAGRLPLTLAQAADDMAAVFDALGWQDAVVAGCSMGGCIAQSMAERHPSRVAGLGLIDTTAWYGLGAPERWAERAAKAEAEGFAALLPFQKQRWFSDAFLARRPDVFEACKTVFLDNDIATYKAACEMLGSADFRAALPRFGMPAAVIVGEEDYATPVEMAQFLADHLPDATLTIIPKAKHFTPYEAPETVADGVSALLDRAYARGIAAR